MVDVTRNPDGTPVFDAVHEAALKDGFYAMVCLMRRLRRQCPWDRRQTPQSLRRYVLEETYEVLETIDNEDWQGLREELGDFMFQAVFQAEIQAEAGRFDIADVMALFVEKMVRRHPHVFGETSVSSAEDVAANWEALKRAEKGDDEGRSHYDGLTRGLPAMLESFKIGKKAAKVGFDWPEPERVLLKVQEEIEEVRQADRAGNRAAVQEELGDLMFCIANLVRKYGFEPEETLRAANAKFIRRFRLMEDLARARAQRIEDLDLSDQEELWQAAKQKEKSAATSP